MMAPRVGISNDVRQIEGCRNIHTDNKNTGTGMYMWHDAGWIVGNNKSMGRGYAQQHGNTNHGRQMR